MRSISLIMPYYDNPGMLEIHYQTWKKFPKALRDLIEVIIVDDGSPNFPAAKVKRPRGLPKLRIFRVKEDRPWHQHAARNIGAHEATNQWLLLTDMDHVVPQETFEALLLQKNGKKVFTFDRLDAPDMTPKLHPKTGEPHPHPNTFCMTKEMFWSVGGYDEDYCGIYGTDGMFRNRLYGIAVQVHLDAKIIRYSREVQADASTTALPRKEGRPEGAKAAIAQRKQKEGTAVKVLSMPYERAWP